MNAVAVFTTCPSQEVAENLASSLVERRLAACVNIVPGLTSVYRWEGKVERAQEALCIIKINGDRYQELEAAIEELHPYDIPEIIALPINDGFEPYLRWIAESTT